MEHLDNKRKITIMIAIMAAMLFSSLNQTIVSTALPKIIAELGGMKYYSWVFTIYMLTSSITTILVGKLSDLYGRKPFLLVGIGIFILGSFLSGTSNSIFQLITYRGIQGFGAGMIMSTSYSAIGDLFSPRERGRWTGLMSGVYGLASVFGPTLGGYMVDHTSWHWIFWVFLPFGIIALAMIWVLFPKVDRKAGDPVDYTGSLFLTLTMVPLLLAFSWAGSKYDWGSWQISSLFTGSVIALIIFILVERIVKAPVLPLHLFKNKIFTVSNIVGFTMGAGMFGAIMYMPYFIQGVLGISATLSGYITMPMTLSLVLGSTLSGQIISRTGKYKILAICGLAVMASGMFLLSTMDIDTSRWTAIGFMIILGLGLGFGMPVFTLTIQNAVEQKYLGVATASAQLFRSIGGTIGVSVMGTVLSTRMTDKIKELTAANHSAEQMSKLPPDVVKALSQLKNPQVLLDKSQLAAIQKALPADFHSLFEKMVYMLREALSYSLEGVFFTGAIVIVVAIVTSFFLKEIPLRTSSRKSEDDKAEGIHPKKVSANNQ